MAESLLTHIAGRVLAKIAGAALQEASAIYGVENQISELGQTVTAIKAVLLDAEEQQAKSHHLQVWLHRLRDVLYDAEDVLDQVECEALRKQLRSHFGGVQEKMRSFFSRGNPLTRRVKLHNKVKEIRERLSKISIEKDQFTLNVRSADDDGRARIRSREMTYSFVDYKEVVGREDDKEKLIEMLMRHEDDKDLSVIPIVGIAGMGKTTVAKLVYNDNRVIEQFELRLWVCVPEDFDLKKTIKAIIQNVTDESLHNLDNLDIQQLQTLLQGCIKDKKYLLVLDDVWRNDHNRWIELRGLLSQGASESAIIVTTRNLEIALMMGTNPAHNLKELSLEDSMVLFRKFAFDDKEREPCPELLEIGKNIVEKSYGVPILVRTLGSLLYTKHEARHWAHVRDSETWKLVEADKDILPVLKLSYDHLPSHLKSCFVAFSLLPRGKRVRDFAVKAIWNALGFIGSTDENLGWRDVADEYLKELGKRSMIQEVQRSGTGISFRVHDLLHSLAMSMGQDDFSTVSHDTAVVSQRYIRFSSSSLEGISNVNRVPPFLRKPPAKKLRAFVREIIDDGYFSREFVRACISQCCCLRYLSLSCSSFEELPSSICNLKQLRFLDISYNDRLKKLPNSICRLQSLLVLLLNGCTSLESLPKNMERLVNLIYLYVTTKDNSLQETGIQYLENLQTLGIGNCPNLQVLFKGTCRLTCLRELMFLDCERPMLVPFEEISALEQLSIRNCTFMLTQENKANFLPNLRGLLISMSEQVMELLQCCEGQAHSLKHLIVLDCPSLTVVPECLLNFTHLKSLELVQCPNLSSMPHGIQSLTTIEELVVNSCGDLAKKCQPQTGEDWQKIAHIRQIVLDDRYVQTD